MEEVNRNNNNRGFNSTGQHENLGENKKKNDSNAKLKKIPSSAWITLAILSSIATMVMYTETMLVPSLPTIITEFNLSYSVSPWILTTYLIVGAVMTPVTSSLAEIYGKKKVLLIVMGIYSAGVITGGLTTNLYSFVIARAMQGVGISMFPIAFSVIREQFPKSRLAIGQGIITSMYASGSIIGLLVGATIAEQSGWRTTFISIIPIAIMLPIVVWKFVKIGNVHPDWKVPSPVESSLRQTQQQPLQYIKSEDDDKKNDRRLLQATSQGSKRSLDMLGAITLAATITLFLLTLTFIETTSSSDVQSISQLILFSIACLAAFIAFIIVERRATYPLIAFKLLQNKILLFANVMMIILGFSMFMIFQTIPILAESPRPAGFGDDITGAAAIQIPYSVILLIFGPTAGYVVSKLGSIRPAIMGYVINALGFFIIAAFHSQAWMVSVGLAIISTGLSLGSVGLMNIVLLATPYRNMVTSIGMTTLLRIVGSAVGPAVAGVLMQLHQVSIPGYAAKFPSSESYTVIFLMAAAMSTVSVMMTLKIRQSLKDNNKAAEASTLGSLNTRSSSESSAAAAATTNDNNSSRSGDIN